MPLTGTCYGNEAGGVFCQFVMPRGLTGRASISLEDASMEWETTDIDGRMLERGFLPVLGIK